MHENQGVVVGLYSNIIMNNLKEPNGYSKEKVLQILENMKSNEIENNQEVKPNIIVIMSESFFDPTVLENITFSKDPIPNIRKLINEYTSGKFISSTFAGGTSNIEFELFTGKSIAYLPYGTVPYTDLKENLSKIDTLPKIMKNNGYKTVAIHTYDKTFYDRHINYPNIGFDEFIGVDEIHEPKYFGKYLSDETFVDNIIKKIEENESEFPMFVWGLTMQNHTPYATSNYSSELEITVEGANLTDVAKDKITAYTNGIYESDKATQKLINYLEESDTPTVLLFFGDHLPSQYETYFDTGLIHTKDTTKWTTEEMIKLHEIPFFIYDNFNYKTEYSHDEIIGAAFLGNYLCNYIGTEKTEYFKFLDTINYKAIRDRLFVDKNGESHEKVTEEYREEMKNHQIMQYDGLFGENYIYEK